MTGQDRGQERLGGVDPTEGRGRANLDTLQALSAGVSTALPFLRSAAIAAARHEEGASRRTHSPDLPPPPPAWSRGFTYQHHIEGDTNA